MAARKKTEIDKKDEKRKEKRVRFSFLSDMQPEKKLQYQKFSGLAVGVFTLMTLLAVVSYLFTWTADQSLLSEPDMMSSGVEAANAGSKLGYKWSRFLVEDCFGLGSFAVIFLLGFIAYKLFHPENRVKMFRISMLSISCAFLLSLLFSYLSSLVCDDTFFGGGLGGHSGSAVIIFLKNLIGVIPTGLILLLFVVGWLIIASRRFADWFSALGQPKEPVQDQDQNQPQVQPQGQPQDCELSGTDWNLNAGEGLECPQQVSDTEPFEIPSVPGNISPQVTEQKPVIALSVGGQHSISRELPAEEGVHVGQPESKIDEEPDARGIVKDKVQPSPEKEPVEVPIEIVTKNNINTEVKEDLPRIDNREELEKYQFPSLDLLEDYSSGQHKVSQQELETNNNRIRATLMNYRVEVVRVTAVVGPTVTLYKVVPAPGVKVSSIEQLHREIAMALGAKGVRVVTLSDCVGIEVPNGTPSIVPLKAMLNSDDFRNSKAELPIAIGYTITQEVKTFDLTDAPHLLVAGATKQGKSVGLNVIISSLLYSKHPSELKFVFIDPKVVEFTAYKGLLKHYLAVLPTAADEKEEADSAIVNSPKQAQQILNSLCIEMDERYNLLRMAGVNDLKLYNEKYKDRLLLPTEGHKYLPYIVVVIDEYADLTMSGGVGSDARKASKEIETSIIRLAQKGRAAGIHVIIATQRPSVNVVTGLIKANFPTRIAFRVTSQTDSKTILDTGGAENLIGKGDMLYYAGVDVDRVQCALVSMKEITRITRFIAAQTGYKQCYNTPYYLPVPEAQDGESGGGNIDMQNIDAMFEDAARLVVSTQKGSTSDLQRRLGMGYARAGRVMDQLEGAGIVGPQEGSKPRKVLVSYEELEDILLEYVK